MSCTQEKQPVGLLDGYIFLAKVILIWVVSEIIGRLLFNVLNFIEQYIKSIWNYLKRKYETTKHKYHREWDVEVVFEKDKKDDDEKEGCCTEKEQSPELVIESQQQRDSKFKTEVVDVTHGARCKLRQTKAKKKISFTKNTDPRI